MFQDVTLPLWLLLLIVGFAAVTFASHFLFPSVRWFFRKRAERALARLNTRLDRPIELFKLARRQDMIVRLTYDPRVMEAVAEHAAETGVPGEVAFEEAAAMRARSSRPFPPRSISVSPPVWRAGSAGASTGCASARWTRR